MEDDDDEFGDLYTDVLRPISFPVSAAASSSSAVATPPPHVSSSSATAVGPRSDPDLSPSTDGDGDGQEQILFGSSVSVPAASIPSRTLASPAADVKDAGSGDVDEDDDGGDWMLGRDPAVAEVTENWGEDEDEGVSLRPADVDAACVPAEGKTSALEDDCEEETRVPGIPVAGAEIAGVDGIQAMEEVRDPVFGGGTGEDPDELGQAVAIPGLSSVSPSLGTILGVNRGEAKPAQSDDWDSDSEDDLQIVLNDNSHGLPGVERNNINRAEDDDDEDGEEDLIIVTDADQQHHLPITEEQQWGEEAMQPTGESDKKETGDIPKAIGAPGIVAGTRIGYSSHGFNAQHHSLYKYIRPGTASVSGGPVAGAIPSATRPPLTSGSISGRGRGDWRPAGGRGIGPAQKSYHTGFGVPNWGNSSGVRAFGSGLDFTLPAHKTIFDIDIESFDEKPWTYPGADVSDYFNFGLDEDKWKDYCKQLEQLRLEATMQSKIRVYESGRSEQEYDPDLPPELAAAAGHHDISADGGHAKADNGQADFNTQGRGPAIMRPPIPTGRAIQVESGYGERLPSIDTRPPRIRDSDAVIEIVLQYSFDDPKVYNNVEEQPGKALQKDHIQGSHENEDEKTNRLKHSSNGRNGEITGRMPSVSEGDCIPSLPSESSAEYHHASRRSPLHSNTSYGSQNGERLPRGHSHGRCDTAHGFSDGEIPEQSAHSKCLGHKEKKNLANEGEINQISEISADIDDTARQEMSTEQNCDEKEEKLALINEIEGDTNVERPDVHDENLDYSSKKLNLSSQVEQPDARDAGDEGDLRISNSDSSREKSGSSKDYLRRHENSEEVLQGRSSRTSDYLRHLEGEEHSYRRKDDYGRGAWQKMDGSHSYSKGREDMPQSYQHREWDSNSAPPARGRSFEKAESEVTARRRREDNLHGRRVNAEDMRGETSDETMSRYSGKLRSGDRNIRDGDFHSRKQSEDREWRSHSREGSSRQREKDSYLMNRREKLDDPLAKRKRDEYLRDENTKMKNKEDSSQRKREGEDVIDQRKKDESTRMREKADARYSAKHKDDSWRYKEREDRQRLKQPRESVLSHREREQGQGLLKATRAAEGKPLSRDVRYKEELTAMGSDRDYQDKDRRLLNENIRRGERTREDSLPQKKGRGDVPSREKQSNVDERSSRHERISLHGDRPPIASNNQQMYKERNRENMKKNKDTNGNEQSSQVLGKRKHEDHNSRRNEKASMKELNESNNASSASFSKKDGQVHQQPDVQPANSSLRKQGVEDPTSDDENQQDSRRGRSKLERWTSNKERDYGAIENKQKLPVPSRAMDIDGNNIDAVQSEELPKTEPNNNAVDADEKVVDTSHLVETMEEDRDPHLDTVAKLKRRSERFKLPMPSEKEMASSRKQDDELQAPHSESVVTNTEVRPERPARKRRWNGRLS